MTHEIVLVVIAVFLASVVEAVEALTIVLAVALTTGWRTALLGAGLAVLALVLVVFALGPALVRVIPIDGLQVIIGVLLLIFGLQWLRKAILRASGMQAQHDEAAIFEEEVALLSSAAASRSRRDIDWTGFVVSFKGVFLEGLEVAFIVLTFAANREHALGWSAIKFTVGLMLVAFGAFWGGEGIGIEWTLGDWTILLLTGLYTLVAWLLVITLKRGGSLKRGGAAVAARSVGAAS